MQLNRVPSVRDTYFQHKVLTRINQRPTYASLQNCLNELKANASSVPSTLGVREPRDLKDLNETDHFIQFENSQQIENRSKFY